MIVFVRTICYTGLTLSVMQQKLTLGLSPCPNDTFIFDALINGKINTRGLSFDYLLEDVETLNQWAYEGRLDFTKISFSALLHLTDNYRLLHSGGALGRGVGPLLIAREPLDLSRIGAYRIAIPGIHTTANLLLSLAFPGATNKQACLFHEIEEGVLSGDYDAGVIIHENRFTYAAKGLILLADMGAWWEQEMSAAIPLGCIAGKQTIDLATIAVVDELIRESIAYAWQHYPSLPPFVTTHAQEMEPSVMRRHIELYVNEYSLEPGVEGRKAVYTLFREAAAKGLTAGRPDTLYY